MDSILLKTFLQKVSGTKAFKCNRVKPVFRGHLNIQDKLSLHEGCQLYYNFLNKRKIIKPFKENIT